MKRKSRIMICAATLISAAVLATAVQGSDFRGGHCGGMLMKHEMHLDRMVHKLGLNEEQQTILLEQTQARRAMHSENIEKHNELHAQLEELMTSELYDENRAEELAAQISDAVKQSVLQRSKAMHMLYQSLDETQRLEFKKLHDKRNKHMRRFFEDDED